MDNLRDAISEALERGLSHGEDVDQLTARVIEIVEAWTAELPGESGR